MADVHVIGAGPAGTIAAISAIRSGHNAVISEDHPAAGLPENCSGLFSVDGLESLRSFVDYRKTIINPIFGANIHLDGTTLSIRKENPVAFACNRALLDSLLASNAESEGAKINYGERISGNFHSNNIIGADGPFSQVARHFSFPKIKKFATTLQADVPFRCEDANMVEIFLSNEKFPGFFGWVIPHSDEKAEFGVGVEVPSKAINAWNSLLMLKKVQNAPKPTGDAIPLETRSKTAKKLSGKNILLVGDAAGQVKSTTGGGVIFGGNCAALAGRFATDPHRYEMEWRLKYGADLALHGLLHGYLASQSESSLSSLGRRLKKLNTDVYLSKHGHMDRPTKMVRPDLIVHIVRSIIGV